LPGRKSDVSDCQWLQQLHTFGLLNGSFRPKDEVCVLRTFLRLRDTLVKDCGSHVLRMQKALTEMNVQIHRVLSDITGYTGMAIIRAILTGERNALTLAQMKHPQVKASTEQIVKALEGDYRPEHLFALQTAVELYDAYHLKITESENKIEQQLEQFETKLDFEQVLEQSGALKVRSAKVRLELQRQAYLTSVCGVDLTRLPGLSTLAVEVIISETGLDMSCWKSEKHFCSWLKVCPDNRISGGKVLSSKSRKTKNRAAGMFRLAAQGAMQSKTAIGALSVASEPDWVRQRPFTPAPTSSHDCSTACSSSARLTSSRAKPTTNRGTKTAYCTISVNEPKNWASNSRLEPATVLGA
jgi:transposase